MGSIEVIKKKKKQLRRYQCPFLGWEKIFIKSLHWTNAENKDKQRQLFALKGLKKRLGEESREIEFASSLEFSNGNRSMYLYTAFKSCFNPNLPTTIKDRSESEIAQLCPALCDPMDCSLPGSSNLGIFQARILEWVAISFSRRSSQPRDWTQVSCTVGRCFTIWATSEVQISMQISLSLLPTYLAPFNKWISTLGQSIWDIAMHRIDSSCS